MGHFVMVPLNLTYLHCLQHSLFEHLFNLYYDAAYVFNIYSELVIEYVGESAVIKY